MNAVFGYLRFYEIKFQNHIRAQSAYNVVLILWIKSKKDLILPPSPPDSVLSPWDQGGMIFVSSARQGATAKLQEPGWGHIQGGDDFRQSSRGGTALSWRIVGISTKCFTLNFTNFACSAILYFSNFFTTHHTVYASINTCYIIMYKAKETPYTVS